MNNFYKCASKCPLVICVHQREMGSIVVEIVLHLKVTI